MVKSGVVNMKLLPKDILKRFLVVRASHSYKVHVSSPSLYGALHTTTTTSIIMTNTTITMIITTFTNKTIPSYPVGLSKTIKHLLRFFHHHRHHQEGLFLNPLIFWINTNLIILLDHRKIIAIVFITRMGFLLRRITLILVARQWKRCTLKIAH